MSENFLDTLSFIDDIKFTSFDENYQQSEITPINPLDIQPISHDFDEFLKNYISNKEKIEEKSQHFDIENMDVIFMDEPESEIIVTNKENQQFHLKIKILDESPEKSQKFSCVICNLQFNSKFNLDRHFNSQRHAFNEGEFSDLSDLIEEEIPDEIDVKFETAFCKECSKVFKNPYQLKIHQQSVHRSYKCKKCSRGFKNEKELLLHMDRHKKEELFRCQHCNKTFTNNTNMRRHEKLHLSAIKTFGCGTCGKTFSQKTNLQRHEKTHK